MELFEKKLKTFLLISENRQQINDDMLNAYFDIEHIKINGKNDEQTLLWSGLKECLQLSIENNFPYIGVIFNESLIYSQFNQSFLEQNIHISELLRTNILICNAYGRLNTVLPLTENLFWIDRLDNLDFIIIFKKCYQMFLDMSFNDYHTIGEIISDLSSNKLLLFPMIIDNESKQLKSSFLIERLIRLSLVRSELEDQ